MPESAEEVYARVVAAVGEGGHLPAPPVTEWETFPWAVVDGAIGTKPLAAPAPEIPREGEQGPCPLCAADLPGRIWENERWRVKHLARSGLPLIVLLETKEHLDFPDLDEELASEYGRLAVRLARIIESLPDIGRCHVGRWGDGSSHFHVWFMARTAGLLSTKGSFATEWDDILPPGPEEVWRADLAAVARKLATHDGTALV
jgi:hypothetical protein